MLPNIVKLARRTNTLHPTLAITSEVDFHQPFISIQLPISSINHHLIQSRYYGASQQAASIAGNARATTNTSNNRRDRNYKAPTPQRRDEPDKKKHTQSPCSKHLILFCWEQRRQPRCANTLHPTDLQRRHRIRGTDVSSPCYLKRLFTTASSHTKTAPHQLWRHLPRLALRRGNKQPSNPVPQPRRHPYSRRSHPGPSPHTALLDPAL